MSQTTVLIVTRDGLTRRLTADGLVVYGHEVLTAPDGEAAVAILRGGQTIDVLVTDVALGHGIDGLALARLARDLNRRASVIYTARAPHLVPESQKVSGAPVLRTPYWPQQVAGLITALQHGPGTGTETGLARTRAA